MPKVVAVSGCVRATRFSLRFPSEFHDDGFLSAGHFSNISRLSMSVAVSGPPGFQRFPSEFGNAVSIPLDGGRSFGCVRPQRMAPRLQRRSEAPTGIRYFLPFTLKTPDLVNRYRWDLFETCPRSSASRLAVDPTIRVGRLRFQSSGGN